MRCSVASGRGRAVQGEAVACPAFDARTAVFALRHKERYRSKAAQALLDAIADTKRRPIGSSDRRQSILFEIER
jgi:hypothetical protein